jgi:hypothetical protein
MATRLNAQATANQAKTTSNIAQFEKEVKDFTKGLTDTELPLFIKKIVLELLRRVVMRTPVDTGHARGNWNVAIGQPDLSVTGKDDKIGTAVLARGLQALTNMPPFSIVWVSNNVQYIDVLEFGGFEPPNPGPSKDPRPGRKGRILVKDGFSTQAPQGMLGLAIAELQAAFP